jgi:hypothetical protein
MSPKAIRLQSSLYNHSPDKKQRLVIFHEALLLIRKSKIVNLKSYPQPPLVGARFNSSLILGMYSNSCACGSGSAAE